MSHVEVEKNDHGLYVFATQALFQKVMQGDN